MRSRSKVAIALALLAVAGCGGDDERPAPPPAATPQTADPRGDREPRAGVLTVEAQPDGSNAFRQTELRAPAGRVALELVNLSATSHSLCVDAEGQGALGCTGTFRGDRSTLRLRLQPGRYAFFCSVPGHRQAGMEGTLVVE